jgi:ADP-ribose pyrophosphatase YjhB (NUDIX family)
MKNYPKLNIGVGGVILKNNSEILLTQRKSKPNVWAIPSGYMELGETIFTTITREVKEETNIVIKPKGIVGIRQRLTRQEGNNLWVIVIADYISGEVIPDNTEIDKAKFMILSDALNVQIAPTAKQILKLMRDNKLQTFLPQKSLAKQNYTFFA